MGITRSPDAIEKIFSHEKCLKRHRRYMQFEMKWPFERTRMASRELSDFNSCMVYCFLIDWVGYFCLML